MYEECLETSSASLRGAIHPQTQKSEAYLAQAIDSDGFDQVDSQYVHLRSLLRPR